MPGVSFKTEHRAASPLAISPSRPVRYPVRWRMASCFAGKNLNRRFVILCPMAEEMDAVLALGRAEPQAPVLGFPAALLTLRGREALVVRCGVGKVQSALVAQRVIDAYRPEALILTGVAGALAPDLRPGDAVIARDTVQHDLDVTALGFARGEVPFSGERFFPCAPELVDAAATAVVPHGLRIGRILTGDRFVTGADRACHAYLREELHGDAVEMEGAAVGQVCARNAVPYVVIRTISDRADGAAPVDFLKVLGFAAANAAAVTAVILDRA